MTDFITKNSKDEESQKASILNSLRSMFSRTQRAPVSLVSEADFASAVNSQPDLFEQSLQEVQASDKLNELKKRVKRKKPKGSTQTLTLNSGDLESYRKRVPLIGRLPTRTQYLLSLFVTTVALAGLLFAFLFMSSAQSKMSLLQNDTTSLVADLQSLSSYINRASNDDSALSVIVQQQQQIENRIVRINLLAKDLDVQTSPTFQQMGLEKNWKNIVESLSLLQKNNSAQINALNTSVSQLNNFLKSKSVTDVNILALSDSLSKVRSYTSTLMSSDKRDDGLVELIQRESNNARVNLLNLKNQDTFGVYSQAAYAWVQLYPLIDDAVTYSYIGTQNSVTSISNNIITAVNQINSGLFKFGSLSSSEDQIGRNLLYFFIVLLILSLVVIVYIYLYEKENEALLDKIANQQNNHAIVRVLDEVGPLSEGNLTKQITMDHELTGAIADAINTMVKEIRVVVRTIRDSAVNMQTAVEDTNSLSQNIFQQSDEQYKKIQHTGSDVLSLTSDIDRISEKASSFEEIAFQTVKASDNGTQSVSKSIESMGSIKANMNETVRVVTRLNDLSTQLSQIVELLSDITEETTVLALNATVQASRAGEAGKAFKIVADSVKSLSNKATEATRKAGALINASKSDIQEIVSSVQKTNIEVENGTQLSAKAGEALEEIKNGSVQLQNIIRQISDDTRRNKKNAQAVTSGIEEILQSTEQTKDSNDKIAKSISSIDKISHELNKTVKHFIVE